MRKVLVLLLVLMMLVVCSSCSNKEETPKTDELSVSDNLSINNLSESSAIKLPIFGSVKVDDIITFGHYEQDNNLDNGKEPIEWIVLDVQDSKALLLSRYGLDYLPYNTDFVDSTWESCTLRAWLNSDFLSNAFTVYEQEVILLTEVDNSSDQGFNGWKYSIPGGNNTLDRLFLLSYAEANKYLDVQYWKIDENAEQNMKARVSPTDYAIAKGAFAYDAILTESGLPTASWWLRSPGDYYQYNASKVFNAGSLDYDGVDYKNVIRPALWVNLNSGK